MLDIQDISQHAATQEKASLNLTDPVVEERLEDEPEGTGNDPIVGVDNRKGPGFARSVHRAQTGISVGRLFG